MNRISKPTATEAGEALLEAGRTEPSLHYDVELGLARHHHWLRSDAPLPEWASASAGTAAQSLAWVAMKAIVSVMLVGAIGIAVWGARHRPQPSAAEVKRSSPRPENAPKVGDVPASEAWLARTPIPVPPEAPASDQPARLAARTDVPAKRTTRLTRPHNALATARAASARTEPEPSRSSADGQSPGTAAHASAPANAAPASAPGSQQVSADRAAPQHKPLSAADRARGEPAREAQAPTDLVEMQQVATAEQLLQRSPQRALALVHQGDQQFARGYFQQERAYIAIMALIGLGRIEEARARAASFAKQFPPLPYGVRIRSALEARDTPRSASGR